MIRSIIVFSLAFFLTTGCYQTKIKVDYTLTNEQMAHLMLDLQLSEVALAEVYGAKKDSLKNMLATTYIPDSFVVGALIGWLK